MKRTTRTITVTVTKTITIAIDNKKLTPESLEIFSVMGSELAMDNVDVAFKVAAENIVQCNERIAGIGEARDIHTLTHCMIDPDKYPVIYHIDETNICSERKNDANESL